MYNISPYSLLRTSKLGQTARSLQTSAPCSIGLEPMIKLSSVEWPLTDLPWVAQTAAMPKCVPMADLHISMVAHPEKSRSFHNKACTRKRQRSRSDHLGALADLSNLAKSCANTSVSWRCLISVVQTVAAQKGRSFHKGAADKPDHCRSDSCDELKKRT